MLWVYWQKSIHHSINSVIFIVSIKGRTGAIMVYLSCITLLWSASKASISPLVNPVAFNSSLSVHTNNVGEYTSDFVCTKTDGDLMVRECVFRKFLMKPLTVKLLDASILFPHPSQNLPSGNILHFPKNSSQK